MGAIFYPISIEQGSAYEITFYYADENGTPIDITNFCVYIQWRTNTNQLYSFSNRYKGNDYSLQSNPNGTIVFKIPARITNSYLFDNAVYDLDLQEPNEDYPGSGLKTYRLATGSVSIIRRNTDVSLVDCAYASSSFNIAENCDVECSRLDLYSIQYDGDGFDISDDSATSSTVATSDTRLIDNVEVVINGLKHNSPQDLILILSPPSGDKILLSGNSKIRHYAPGFSFMFSNRAPNGAYLDSIQSGQLCGIKDKTEFIKYNNENLVSTFDNLFNNSITGDWDLIMIDSDTGVAGSIDSWKLIITYQP